MGYLTTFTIDNDGINQILENSDDFCEKLRGQALIGRTSTFGHGNHANLVKVQISRHADDPTTYVHMGNTVYEMNVNSRDTKALMQNNPEFFKDMLDYMKRQVGDLEKKFGEYQANPEQKE